MKEIKNKIKAYKQSFKNHIITIIEETENSQIFLFRNPKKIQIYGLKSFQLKIYYS